MEQIVREIEIYTLAEFLVLGILLHDVIDVECDII